MAKRLPTGITDRINPTTGRKQYRARLSDPSARTPSGRTKQASSRWLNSLAEANEWLENARHLKRTLGTLDFDRSISVSEACDIWIKVATTAGTGGRGRIQETTEAEYQSVIRRNVKPTIGEVKIADLTKQNLKRWLDMRVGEVGPDAAKRALGVLKQVLAYQSEIGAIPANPAAELKQSGKIKNADGTSAEEGVVDRFMDPEDVQRILHAADQIAATGSLSTDKDRKNLGLGQLHQRREAWKANRVLVYLLLASGMRIGEAAALQWKHVLWSEKAVSIEQAYKRRATKKIGAPKSATSRRHVTLGNRMMGMLRELYSSRNDVLPDDYVFGGKSYRSPTHWTKRSWRDLMEEAGFLGDDGMPVWTPHDCRHYHASFLIDQGKNDDQVAERLGHSNSIVTRTIYVHLFNKRKGLRNTIGAEDEEKLIGA